MVAKKVKTQRRVTATGGKKGFNVNEWLEKISFSNKNQQAFLEDFATLVNDGVPASRAIDVIVKVEQGPKKKVAQALAKCLSEGRSIADGMIGWFSDSTVELIRAGEQGGSLAENMQAAAKALSSKASNINSVIASILYPLVVIMAACGVLIYLNHSVFPQFASIKPIEEWPEIGVSLVAFANFIQLWWWLVIVLLIATIIAVSYMLHNLIGRRRTFVDTIPILSLYRQIESARFMETLGLLIANGIVFKRALKIIENQASPYLGWHLKMMQIRLGKGSTNIAEILETKLIGFADIQRLKAIAEAKGFEHALIRLGRHASDQASATIKRMGKILGMVLLVIGASLAIFMILGIYSVGASLAG